MLYRVCGGGRIEAKFPWNAKSIYPLCVPPTTTGVPFKAPCAVSTGQILDRRIKRGCLSIYLLFPGRWIVTVRCNYLKPVSNTRFLTRLVEIFR